MIKKTMRNFLRISNVLNLCCLIHKLINYHNLKVLNHKKLIVFHDQLLEACPFAILFQPVSVYDASFAEADDRRAFIPGWLSYTHGNFQVSTTTYIVIANTS